jgi:gas vesicle protein
MSTKKRRVATYIPSEIEDKFQAFRQEKGVGDSQALILILTEFLGVSQIVAYSGDSLEKIKSELLSELRGELSREIEELENRLGEKIGKLKSESPETEPKVINKLPDQKKLNIPVVEAASSGSFHEKGSTGAALAKRLGWDDSELSKQARGKTREEFANWSKEKDPDGIAWERREDKKYYPLPASLSEEGAEAQSSHPKGLAF